ncbi:hypothetical protein [Draconibacterium sp.]|uniref:hypothetical protein n=1 Tax=Draconibacterium sp. TaxID=1965318 RepID=UPI003563DDCE
MTIVNFCFFACLFLFNSCEKEELFFTNGEVEIQIETGKEWLHDFPLFLGLNKKNPPQYAVWIEDTDGNYLSTVFVTYKIATEGWQANKGNRRKESLPHWCHQRGIVYEDGLLLPTKENPLTDGITGATPKENQDIKISIATIEKPFVVKAEFNHSVDFNGFFPENSRPEDENYSGGEDGSGQPAVVYAATVYPETETTELQFKGHSSPDGTDGIIYDNPGVLTSAKSIVKKITITVK